MISGSKPRGRVDLTEISRVVQLLTYARPTNWRKTSVVDPLLGSRAPRVYSAFRFFQRLGGIPFSSFVLTGVSGALIWRL